MGTMLQSSDVTVDDFQGLEGCNEILNITVPTSCPDSTTLTGTMLMGSETGVTLTVNPLASTPSITTPMVAPVQFRLHRLPEPRRSRQGGETIRSDGDSVYNCQRSSNFILNSAPTPSSPITRRQTISMPSETHTATADRFFAAVLWDFDGTLVDTESRWVEAELAILASHGIVWEPEQANEFTGGPLTDVCEAMAADLGGSVTVDDVRCELITMVSQFNRERDVPWRPGVLDLLTEIREAGIPMGIVTGSAHAVVEPVLEAMAERIGNPFDTVVTFDDVIPETAKPAPDPYLLAAERLGVSITDCLAIEDSPKGARR